MKEQISTLIQLQDVDLQQERLRAIVDQKREKTAHDEALLEDLSLGLEKQLAQLEDTKALQRSKQLVLQEAQAGLSTAKTKFANSSNSRDYAASEREVENYRKIVTQLEEEIEQLRVAIEDSNKSYDKHKEDVEQLKSEIQKQLDEVEQAQAEVADQLSELTEKSKSFSKLLKPQILARYRFIRSRRPGEAVVPACNGTCSGCHMKLPPQLFIQVQKQNSLECCQNCQRILYFEEQNPDENN